MTTVSSPESPLDRNRGLLTDSEQDLLRRGRVLVAGAGGVGGRTAETLARLGIGTLVLADPDTFSPTNLNRQAGCTTDTVGRNKADVVAELCRAIGTGVEVRAVREGAQPENTADLVNSVDVVVDGTDYTQPAVGLRVAQSARVAQVPVVLPVEVAFGAWVTTVLPTGRSFERLLGLPHNVAPDRLARGDLAVPLWRWIGRLPSYVRLDALRRVASGELDAPAVAPAVELAAALTATAVTDLLLGRRPAATAPRILHVDARSGTVRTYRPSRARFLASVAVAAVRR